jgi:hypothetical protein
MKAEIKGKPEEKKSVPVQPTGSSYSNNPNHPLSIAIEHQKALYIPRGPNSTFFPTIYTQVTTNVSP